MATLTELISLDGWEDVTPVSQKECDHPVVDIAYDFEYEQAMSYLRAAIASEEYSERALALTVTVIELNAAHYTAWRFRRQCLFALGKDLVAELDFTARAALDTPKNYQIWHHRRAVVEHLGDGSHEIAFLNQVLLQDAKNYHAWAHRQWAVQQFGLWEGELQLVTRLLDDDLRNNSAWNHRWFVVHNDSASGRSADASPAAAAVTAGFTLPMPTVAREVEFAFSYIEKAVHNESPWTYLKGFFMDLPYAEHPQVKERCLALLAASTAATAAAAAATSAEGEAAVLPQQPVNNDASDCRHLFNLLAEVHEQEESEESLNAAIELLQRLRNDIDAVREKYWERRIVRATHKLERVVSATD